MLTTSSFAIIVENPVKIILMHTDSLEQTDVLVGILGCSTVVDTVVSD